MYEIEIQFFFGALDVSHCLCVRGGIGVSAGASW